MTIAEPLVIFLRLDECLCQNDFDVCRITNGL